MDHLNERASEVLDVCYALIVTPVALGKGLPLSELAASTPLKLMSSKAFPGGAVAQIYRAA